MCSLTAYVRITYKLKRQLFRNESCEMKTKNAKIHKKKKYSTKLIKFTIRVIIYKSKV